MSKELTPLKAWEEVKDAMLEWTEGYEENFNLIEKTLKDYEKTLKDYEETDNQIYDSFEKFGINHRKDLLKKLKVLEIIIEKDVDVHNFKEFIIKQHWTYKQYVKEENDENTSKHQFAYKLLTQDEFDLLKKELYQI